MALREVVVTGFGVVLPGCNNVQSLWQQLSQAESQLRMQPNPADPSKEVAMGRVWDFTPETYLSEIPARFYERYDREIQLHIASLFLARDDAGLTLENLPPTRVGLFDGCSRPGFSGWYDRLQRQAASSIADTYSRRDLLTGTPGQAAGIAASLLQVQGPVYTYNSTCSSGAVAIGHAFREIQSGEIDVAFAGGHESSLQPPLYAMYGDASLLSPETDDPSRAVRPFSDCWGNAFGEGAITLVLEAREHAEARGAKCYATLSGYRYGNNGFHPTTPDMAGGRPAQLMREMLRKAKVGVGDVGFIVGHGNAVQLSDASEENYMLLLFGDRAGDVPLVSNKPIYGHLLGASSALNVAASALMLHHQFIAPTKNVVAELADEGFDHVAEVGRAADCNAGISVSLGLGGNNTVVLLERFVATS